MHPSSGVLLNRPQEGNGSTPDSWRRSSAAC
jgi:hypothetical protein